MNTSVNRLLTREARQLKPLGADPAAPKKASAFGSALTPPEIAEQKPLELTWRDYVTMLLHIGAEIEHSLMVQYLFAGYSLGGDHLTAEDAAMVRRWQETVLTVAREEMGHLMTVQNLMRLLGGPITLDREDYPFDTPWNPFPFSLRKFDLESLACYVYAEMPGSFKDDGGVPPDDKPLIDEITATVIRVCGRDHTRPHQVEEIYEAIMHIIADPEKLADTDFRADTYSEQASWDVWGKQYGPQGSAQGSAAGNMPVAHVIIPAMGTRTQALEGLREIAGQGEAPHLKQDDKPSRSRAPAPPDEPSHFDRFFAMYKEYRAKLEREPEWSPAMDVANNPSTTRSTDARDNVTFIESDHARGWATLFNVRYRMLLMYIAHWFRQPSSSEGQPSARTGLLHRAFAEMYNLKTISGVLVTLPIDDSAHSRRAGPPFEMPYTLALPEGEADCWRMHIDLIVGGGDVAATLATHTNTVGNKYLTALGDMDRTSVEWLEQVLTGTSIRRPRT